MIEPVEAIVADGHGGLDPSFLVVHSTANPGASAANHVSYWSSGRTGEYTHYVVDWRGFFYHTVEDDRKCWHVGNANYLSVGIEICEVDDDADFDASFDYAAQAAAWVLAQHGWTVGEMRSHAYCTRVYGGSDHTDPLPYFEAHGRTWDDFASLTDSYLGGGGHDEEEDVMDSLMAIIDYNSTGKFCLVIPPFMAWLSDPWEITAIDEYHMALTGRGVPIFAFGTPERPIAGRLLQAFEECRVDQLRMWEARA